MYGGIFDDRNKQFIIQSTPHGIIIRQQPSKLIRITIERVIIFMLEYIYLNVMP